LKPKQEFIRLLQSRRWKVDVKAKIYIAKKQPKLYFRFTEDNNKIKASKEFDIILKSGKDEALFYDILEEIEMESGIFSFDLVKDKLRMEALFTLSEKKYLEEIIVKIENDLKLFSNNESIKPFIRNFHNT